MRFLRVIVGFKLIRCWKNIVHERLLEFSITPLAGGRAGVGGVVDPAYGDRGAAEEKFEVLQIGTQTYSNVTVTTKAKSYIFLFIPPA